MTFVQARIAALEGGEAGIVFGSGMAAISSTLFTFLQAGDHCVMSEVRDTQPLAPFALAHGLSNCPRQVYGATFELGAKDFPKRGIENTFVTTGQVEDFVAALRPNTKVP